MEDHLIASSGTDVTDAFRAYLQPLLGSDVPQAHRLRAPAVPRRLNAR
jgi:6-phosphofructokinase 1